MRTIFCYGDRPQPEAAEAVTEFAPGVEFCQTKGLYGYCDAVGSHWNLGDDLVIIEGDKIIKQDTIPSLEACDQLWCSYKFRLRGYSYQLGLDELICESITGLGCIKYSARLQAAVPVGEFLHDDGNLWPPCPFCNGAGCWNYLDLRITRAVQAHFTEPVHIHGSLEHKHDYPHVTKISDIKDAKLRSDMQWYESLAGPEWPYREDAPCE